jgi:hypothetical protein
LPTWCSEELSLEVAVLGAPQISLVCIVILD